MSAPPAGLAAGLPPCRTPITPTPSRPCSFDAALAPRHDRIVGGQSRLVELLYRHGRPAGELLLVFVDRWFRTGTIPAEAPGALWEPTGVARVSGGIPARASGDLMALAGHVAGAAARAIRTAPDLLRPVPEQFRPTRSGFPVDRPASEDSSAH
jgi:hypothetical protein